MKKLLVLVISVVMFSCVKKDIVQNAPTTEVRTFGAIGRVDVSKVPVMVSTTFRKGGTKGKPTPPPSPPTDTTVVTPPPPPPPPPVDTVVVTPPQSFPPFYSIAMPSVQNQGSEGSCVSFAAAWQLASEKFYKTGNMVMLSPEFLFDHTSTSPTSCSGSTITTAYSFLMSTGVCSWALMPYSWLNGCSVTPNDAQMAEATQNKILGYTSIPVTDRDAIKTALVNNHSLVTYIAPDQAFCDAKTGFIWKSQGQALGSHCVLICGWDDSKGWLVINSWGTNWGTAGYCYIDYDFFPQAVGFLLKINI